MELQEYLKERIRDERESILMTKYRLAKETGISYQRLSKIERGCNFSIDNLEKICNVLGLKVVIVRKEEKMQNN